MKRILLMLAVMFGLLLGGLLPTSTAEARPWGYRGYAYRPAVSVYAGPRYGYRGYYAPYYRPYYRSYYRPYAGYYYGYPRYYTGYYGYPGNAYYGYPRYSSGYYYYGPRVGVYVR
jgi:hypothetical protein